MDGAAVETWQLRGSRAAVRAPRRGGVFALRGLPLLAVLLLAGCASASASDPSASGLKAAADNEVANIEAGRYKHACEGFTAGARARLQMLPRGGCPAALALSRGLLVVEGHTRLGKLFQEHSARMLEKVRIEGSTARSGGVVVARYEGGRWRFESEAAALATNPARLRADLLAAISSLEAGAGEGLWKEMLPAAP